MSEIKDEKKWIDADSIKKGKTRSFPLLDFRLKFLFWKY
jgi:hypothetical protein|tara:strand:- start:85 stop:201 length:117 start_codon:yes stop_codon:yes gene_type:complete